MPDDPEVVAIDYLTQYNEVNLMQFMVMFVVPVYEQKTGTKNFMEKTYQEYKRLWKKHNGNKSNASVF